MFTPTVRRLFAVLLVGVFSLPCGLGAQGSEPVRINYVNADLRDVVRSLAAAIGINVVLADVPPTRVTFSTPNPVPARDVGDVLDAILESQGLVLVQSGPVMQVIRVDKKPTGGPINSGKDLPSPAPIGLITQIVPLEFMRAEEGVTVVKQIASPMTRVEVIPRSNAVLITDRAGNVRRYLALLKQLDVRTTGEAGLRTYVYRLKHALASELAETLGELFGSAGTGSSGGSRARVRSLESRSLSQTLQQFQRREIDALDVRRGIGNMSVPFVVRAGPDSGNAQGGLAGQTTIVPDQATNSLVIRTAPPNFPVLQETIAALDVRPAQVLIEVMIAEVTLDRSSEFGIDWSTVSHPTIKGEKSTVRTQLGPRPFPDSIPATASGLVVSLVRLDARAVLTALAARTNVRVLSTPHVLALNNEEARILVGSQVPFSQSTRTGLDVVVDRIVQFRDVGTQLTIIPTINDDGYVTFRILQEVSALTTQTIAAALGAPVITTREAETSAIVKNGSTIVIGGLIADERQKTESGIPFLKDIPLLGNLFKSQTSSRTRTELAIFLTPYVVTSDEEAERLLERERQRLDQTREDINRALPPHAPSQPPPARPKP